jgi:hypothetical protein
VIEKCDEVRSNSALRQRLLILAGPAVLVASTGVLFWNVLFPPPGQGLFGFDLGYYFEPLWSWWAVRMRSGSLPFWNPHSFLGAPFFANPQVGLAYPPNGLFLLISPSVALGWGAAFHIALAAVGMYAWAGYFHISRWGRTIAGFTYAFSSFLVLRFYGGHYSLAAVEAWFPWMLYAGFQVCYSASSRSVAVASIVFALAFLAGFPPLFALVGGFTACACLVCALRQPAEKRRRSVAGLLLAGGLAILLVAVQLIPLGELLWYSSRKAGVTYEFASSFPLVSASFLSIVAPDLLTVMGFWEYNLFIGALSVLLGIVALTQMPRRAWRWLALAVVALIVALGDQGGLYRLLYRLVPALGLMRVPARFAIVYLLAVSILAGQGMDSLLRSALSSVRVMLLGLGAGLVAIGVMAWREGLLSDPRTSPLVAFDVVRWCFITGLACLTIWIFRRSSPRLLGSLVMMLVAFDLVSQGGRFVSARSFAPEPRWQVIDSALPGRRDSYRLLTASKLDHQQSLSLGFYQVGGYDPLMIAWAEDIAHLSRELAAPVLDLLSVRYVVNETRLPSLESSQLIVQADDLFIYERSTAMPRAFAVGQYELTQDPLGRLRDPQFNPRLHVLLTAPPRCALDDLPATSLDTVVMQDDEPDDVRLEADLAASRLVVLNDLYYPGWEATVDDAPAQILRADYALRAVCVPQGTHRIEFRYRPRWLGVGLFMSLTGWVIVAVLFSGIIHRRK